MLKKNLGLITNCQVNIEFRHSFCSQLIIDDCTISLETKERAYLLPLYLYPDNSNSSDNNRRSAGTLMMIFELSEFYRTKKANIDRSITEILANTYNKMPSPEAIFFYIYGVLYSNLYRIKFAEFLKINFPRVPFTQKYDLFVKMRENDKRLVDLHLLKSAKLDSPVAKFQGKRENKVKKLKYDERNKLVYVNSNQYFEQELKLKSIYKLFAIIFNFY